MSVNSDQHFPGLVLVGFAAVDVLGSAMFANQDASILSSTFSIMASLVVSNAILFKKALEDSGRPKEDRTNPKETRFYSAIPSAASAAVATLFGSSYINELVQSQTDTVTTSLDALAAVVFSGIAIAVYPNSTKSQK